MTSTVACLRIALNRAWSAAGSWKGWPSAEITLTVLSGFKIAVGAGLAFAFWAMILPSCADSSALVRMRVTCGL